MKLIEALIKFLMNRVELKDMKTLVLSSLQKQFLMNRVELKASFTLNVSGLLDTFLMNRVELKVLKKLEFQHSFRLRFLMNRVELKG